MSAALRQTPDEAFNARAAREGWPAFCDRTLTFRSAMLTELLAIWHQAKGERALPMRSDFTARMLARYLRDISFIERVGPRRYLFRLVGSGLIRMGVDPTGKYLDEIVGPEFVESWFAAYDLALDLAVPLRFLSHFRAFGLEFMTAESLVAPLCNAEGEPWGLLTSTVYSPRDAD